MDDFKFEVIPLFSQPICFSKVKEDLSIIKDSCTSKDFLETGAPQFYHSKNLKILDKFPNQKNIILNYFNNYKNNILKLSTTEFEITTSWVTKTEMNGHSEFHNHGNSIYSGIFYFDECQSGGNLEFVNYNLSAIQLNDPIENNIFNSNSFKVTPQKNLLIIFPSNLFHRVTHYVSNKPRYSLAFNLFPVNVISSADSLLNIKLL